jgi:hypothetical protein
MNAFPEAVRWLLLWLLDPERFEAGVKCSFSRFGAS